jgi:hypothetical protein
LVTEPAHPTLAVGGPQKVKASTHDPPNCGWFGVRCKRGDQAHLGEKVVVFTIEIVGRLASKDDDCGFRAHVAQDSEILSPTIPG